MENVTKIDEKKLESMSKVELIDTALLENVSGAGCERWVETCGNDSFDWCGEWCPN